MNQGLFQRSFPNNTLFRAKFCFSYVSTPRVAEVWKLHLLWTLIREPTASGKPVFWPGKGVGNRVWPPYWSLRSTHSPCLWGGFPMKISKEGGQIKRPPKSAKFKIFSHILQGQTRNSYDKARFEKDPSLWKNRQIIPNQASCSSFSCWNRNAAPFLRYPLSPKFIEKESLCL